HFLSRPASRPLTPCRPLLSPPLRPPPRSPLFPYTTLFRSGRPRGGPRPGAAAQRWCFHLRRGNGAHREPRGTPGPPCRAPALSQDRKSTRLNSSHVKTSYAVFCLKKKNQSTPPNTVSSTHR